VFGEQVAGAAGLAWLDHVCADLEGADYAAAAANLCAAGAEANNEELAMMVRMLVSSLKRHSPHAPQLGDLPSRAVGLLQRLNLMGSPLRTEDADDGGAKAIGAA
jgi:hypothetical protein